MSDTKNIVEALSKFQDDANTASKSSNNPFFKSTYASLEDIIETANKGAKYGLAFTQCVDFDKEVVDGKTNISMFVKTNLMHKASDTMITSKYPVIPKSGKYDDSQALGSAITYAKRYSLQAIYGLPSEDDDGNANTHNEKVNADQKRKMTVWVNSIKQSVKATMDDAEMTKAEKIHDLFMLKKENAGSFEKLLKLDKGQWDMLMQHIIKQEKILGGNDEQSDAD